MQITISQQISRKGVFRGGSLPVSAKFPSGKNMRASEVLANLPHLLASGIAVKVWTPAGRPLDPAALIDKTPKQIEEIAANVDAFFGFDKLRADFSARHRSFIEKAVWLEHPALPFKVAQMVFHGSFVESRQIAAEEKARGREIRIPTEQELLATFRLLGDRLKETGHWIYTETKHKDYPGQFVLRFQGIAERSSVHPGLECRCDVARFVEGR